MLLRYIESLEEKKKILLACHVDATSGHMGKTRTIYRITKLFTSQSNLLLLHYALPSVFLTGPPTTKRPWFLSNIGSVPLCAHASTVHK